MTKVTTSHTYETMTEEMRPQDDHLDGSTLKFETLEHGGEYPDTMPQAVKATDAAGRWCIYVPIEVGGKVVRSHGYNLTRHE